MAAIEQIRAGGALIAIIVRGEYHPNHTEFVTTPDMNMQVGLIKCQSGGVIQSHAHRPIERRITGTSEAILVRSGKVEVFLYDSDRQFLCSRDLVQGDLVLLLAGGHGFTMLEDSVLMEVKQGPYLGQRDKERFGS